MVDEREGDVIPADLPRAFNRQNVWRRIAIVAAGPIANLALAVLLFAGIYVVGVPAQRPLLAPPPATSPAAQAGLAGGDLVTALDGEAIGSWQDLRWRLLKASGSGSVRLEVTHEDGSKATRSLAIAALNAGDWE
jgi:regulator of sigma E protease